jgi:formylglycine-generating enzyme required for sulfatase activity
MSTPDQAVPVRFNHLKQQAKQLLKDVQSGDQEALDRVVSVRPKLADKTPFILADAQSVIAREYGVDSWRQLKERECGGNGERNLGSIHQQLAEACARIHTEFQGTEVTCSLNSAREVTFGEYLASLTSDQYYYTFQLEPLDGQAIIDFSGSVIWGHVYRDGGTEGTPPSDRRDPTEEDRSQLTPMVIRHLQALEQVWGSELKLRVSNAEIQFTPEEARITTDDDPVTITTISVTAPTFDGTVRMVYPTRLITPALDPMEWASLEERRIAEILATRQTIHVTVPAGVPLEAGMKYIPEGPYLAGDHREGKFNNPELPREVHQSAFWMDTYPVTNAEYEKFVLATGRAIPPHWTSGSYQRDQVNHPVANVSYDDAKAYAEWVEKRLPTESEWEKASRGTDGQVYPWGDTYWKDFCNGRNDFGGTTPVDQFDGASPYGVCDMSGNVFEWCQDWYEQDYASSGDTDPQGPDAGDYRVIRGGFYRGSLSDLRCAYRGWAPQANEMDHLGFRCAKDVAESAGKGQSQKVQPLSKAQMLKVEYLHHLMAERLQGTHSVRNGGPTRVKLGFVDQTTFGEVVDSLWSTCHTYQFELTPPGAACILDYALPLRNEILKQLGIDRPVGDAPVTEEERRLFTVIARQDLAILEQTWGQIEPRNVRDAEIEQDKEALDIVSRDDTVILVAFQYTLGETERSLINVVYPLSVFAPVLDKLDALEIV